MSRTITVDTSGLRSRMDALAQVMNANTQKMARFGMKQALTMLLKISPPKNRKQGRDSVARNLAKGFPVLTRKYIRGLRNQRLAEALLKAMRKKGEGVNVLVEKITHKRLVPFDARLYRNNVDKRGRARKGNFITQDEKPWKAYLKKLQDNVGKHRAGWTAAADRVGVAPRAIPAFVREHGGSGGSVREQVKKSSAKVTGINQSNYVPASDQTSRVQIALRYAEQNMLRTMKRVKAGMAAGKTPQQLFSGDVFNDS